MGKFDLLKSEQMIYNGDIMQELSKNHNQQKENKLLNEDAKVDELLISIKLDNQWPKLNRTENRRLHNIEQLNSYSPLKIS